LLLRIDMNTKDFLRLVPLRRAAAGLGVLLGLVTRLASANVALRRDKADFVSKFIVGSGVKSLLHAVADGRNY